MMARRLSTAGRAGLEARRQKLQLGARTDEALRVQAEYCGVGMSGRGCVAGGGSGLSDGCDRATVSRSFLASK